MSVAYDSQGRIDTLTIGDDPLDYRVTDLSYDALNRLMSFTDPEGFVTTFGYDEANRISTVILPDDEVVGIGYNSMGQMTSVTPPGKPAHSFTYTRHNHRETYTLPILEESDEPSVETRHYDSDRRLEHITRPDGNEIVFGYEPLQDRLEKLTTPRGDLTFGYDPQNGKLRTATTYDGETLSHSYDGPALSDVSWSGTVNGSVQTTYDDSFRIESVGVNNDPAQNVGYGYDDDSQVTSAGDLVITRDPETGRIETTTLGEITTQWTYTDFGEPYIVATTLSTVDDEVTLYQEHFTYDKRGWITDIIRFQNGLTVTESFGYDNRGRLETVKHDGVLVSTYGYDANSNRTNYDGPFGTVVDAQFDARDRLVESGGVTFTYNEAGELIEKSANGHSVTYDFDVLGSLRMVNLPAGTGVDYLTDASQRRIGRKVDGALTHGWLYQDLLNPIAELNSAGSVASRFVFATRPNLPDYMIRGESTYRIVADHLGSPRLVVNADTGEIAQELRYDEFGRVTLDTNPGFQPFGYAGGLYDPLTGLIHFGARDYDPEVGKWTRADPLGFAAGTQNLYEYSRSNPIVFFDPHGTFASPATLAQIGGACVLADGPAPVGDLIGAPMLAAAGIWWAASEAVDRWKDSEEDDEEEVDDYRGRMCGMQMKQDDATCRAAWGPSNRLRYACMSQAMVRYSECLRFGKPRSPLQPLP